MQMIRALKLLQSVDVKTFFVDDVDILIAVVNTDGRQIVSQIWPLILVVIDGRKPMSISLRPESWVALLQYDRIRGHGTLHFSLF
jgi:hypothetical protein